MSCLIRLFSNRYKNISIVSTCISLVSRRTFALSSDNILLKSFVCRFQYNLPKRLLKIHSTRFCGKAYDINTDVTKDVVLYKYENPKFFKILNTFGICQFVFWTYLSYFAFSTLRDAPVDQTEGEELKWFQRINLGENKYRIGITTMCFIIGYGILAAVWLFTLRSVRFLVLRKGGRDIAIVTYGPYGHNRIITIPLKCLSAQQPREKAGVLLPIKVLNRSLFYVLDMRGEFKNTQLYDYTAGLHRRF